MPPTGTTVRNLTAAEREKFGELVRKIQTHTEGCELCQQSPEPPEGMCDLGASLYQCWEALLQASTVADAFDRAFRS